MIKIETLRALLKLDQNAIQNLDLEQLRLLLGVLRYSARVVEREIIQRETCGV